MVVGLIVAPICQEPLKLENCFESTLQNLLVKSLLRFTTQEEKVEYGSIHLSMVSHSWEAPIS